MIYTTFPNKFLFQDILHGAVLIYGGLDCSNCHDHVEQVLMRFSSSFLGAPLVASIMPKIIPQNEATSLLSWWSDHYLIKTLFCLLVLCPIIQKGLDNTGVHQIWNTTQSNDFVVTLNLPGKISSDNPKLGCFLCTQTVRCFLPRDQRITHDGDHSTGLGEQFWQFKAFQACQEFCNPSLWLNFEGKEGVVEKVFWSYLMGEIWFCVPKRIRVLKCYWKRNPRNARIYVQVENKRWYWSRVA